MIGESCDTSSDSTTDGSLKITFEKIKKIEISKHILTYEVHARYTLHIGNMRR